MQIAPQTNSPFFSRISIVIPPTGLYCREDRCQSFFHFRLVPSVRAPLEECEAAGALRAIGIPTQIIDAPTLQLSDDQARRAIKEFNPDLVVLVCTFGTLQADLRWARILKRELPSVLIGARGAPAYALGDQMLHEHPALDFCMRGEYELIFQSLVLQGIQETPGLLTRGSSGSIVSTGAPLYAPDLDALPFPDRSGLEQERYRVRLFGGTQATIRVQRGCPYPCSYCLVHTVNGKKARHRSPGSIVAEIQQLQTQGISNFYFRADTFSLDREWALSLAKLLQQECPRINWVTTTRAERVDLELLSEFRKSGCYGISFGVDVTSTEIGRRVNKLPQLQAAQEAMELCHQTGIIALAYIMIGFIWDTKETLAEAEQFVKRMYPDLLTVHFAHPYPGTQYYDDYQKSALSVLSREAQAMPAGNTLTLTRGELQSAAKRLLRTHYLRRRVLASLTRKILRHRFLAS